MAAQMEATTREMSQSEVLISPDKSSVLALAPSGETGKTALGPKTYLMPKPFSLQRNTTIRPIKAPKTEIGRLPRATSSDNLDLLSFTKPADTRVGDLNTPESLKLDTNGTSNGCNKSTGPEHVPLCSKPDLLANTKPEPNSNADKTDSDHQTGTNIKKNVTATSAEDLNEVPPRSRTKFLGAQDKQKLKQRPEGETTTSKTDAEDYLPIWPRRNRLSMELTSRFESPSQLEKEVNSVRRDIEKESPPNSPSEESNFKSSEPLVETGEMGGEEVSVRSIKGRIGLLFDCSTASQHRDSFNKRDATLSEISVDIKQRIKNLSLDSHELRIRLPSTGALKCPIEKTPSNSDELPFDAKALEKPADSKNGSQQPLGKQAADKASSSTEVPPFARAERMSGELDKVIENKPDINLKAKEAPTSNFGFEKNVLIEDKNSIDEENDEVEEDKENYIPVPLYPSVGIGKYAVTKREEEEILQKEEQLEKKLERERLLEEERMAKKEIERQQEEECKHAGEEKHLEDERRKQERKQKEERQRQMEERRKQEEDERKQVEKEREKQRMLERLEKERQLKEEMSRIEEERKKERQREEERLRLEKERELKEEKRRNEEEILRQERENEREMEERRQIEEEERLRQEREKERLKKEKEMEEERRRIKEMERLKEEEQLRQEREKEKIRKEKEMEEGRRQIEEMERQKEEERLRQEKERLQKEREMEEERRRIEEMERQKEEERLRQEKERLQKEREMEEERRRIQEIERQKEEERLRQEKEKDRLRKEREMEEERGRIEEMERQKEEERLRRIEEARQIEEERLKQEREKERLRKEKEMEEERRLIEEERQREEERLKQEKENERLKKEIEMEKCLEVEKLREEFPTSYNLISFDSEEPVLSQSLVSSVNVSPQLDEVLYDDFSVKPRRWGTQARCSSTPSPSREPPAVDVILEQLDPKPESRSNGYQALLGNQVYVDDLIGFEPAPSNMQMSSSNHTESRNQLQAVDSEPEFWSNPKTESSALWLDGVTSHEGQIHESALEEDEVTEQDLIKESDNPDEINDTVDNLVTESRIVQRVKRKNKTDSDPTNAPGQEEPESLHFPESSAPLLDSSVFRSKVDLGKKRSIKRCRPSRAVRQRAALPMLTEGTHPDWRFCDSTDVAAQCSNGGDSESEEEPSKDYTSSPAPSQPKRVPLFPGMDQSALMAQLKRRSGAVETDTPSEGLTTPTVPAHSPCTPTMSLGPRVLLSVDSKDSGSGSSPSWLLELKSKKRASQPESEA